MSEFQKSIDVEVPVRMAYDQWTQFERFPRFMEGVEEVRQIDARRLHWRARIGGQPVEWDAEIVEQVPDRVISWKSTSGPKSEGTVRFESLGETTCRVSLLMTMEPQTLTQRIGTVLGSVALRIRGDLERFKAFVESIPAETGAWRGEIRQGIVLPPPSAD